MHPPYEDGETVIILSIISLMTIFKDLWEQSISLTSMYWGIDNGKNDFKASPLRKKS